MRTAIISDVHANMEALDAVLRHAAGDGGIDALWCLGDAVGYGPDPSAAIAELRARAALVIAGNHDLAACGRMGVEDFNPVAAAAALWTRDRLTANERAWLAALPLTAIAGDFTLVHGSLRYPEWEYLLSVEQALDQFGRQTTPYSIVGHSHLLFRVTEDARAGARFEPATDGDRAELDGARRIFNPGSVGQPRDGDPRASYMLYDDAAATVTWHRVAYDFAATQRKIVEAGLPEWLAVRLELGT